MSIDFELHERVPQMKILLAMRLLNDVIPRILSEGEYMGLRIAMAYTWYKFLCKISRCPENVPPDIERWNLDTVKIIVDELIDFARDLLKDYLSPSVGME